MAGSKLDASPLGHRAHQYPALRRGQVLVLERSDDPNERLYTVILNSKGGTRIRANVALNAPWSIPAAHGHFLEFKLTEVGRFPGPMMFGYRTRPASFEVKHARGCPGCSGLAKGSTAFAVQKERAKARLAKACP